MPGMEEIIEVKNAPSAETIYVAVARDGIESLWALSWAILYLLSRKGGTLVLLHVHVPVRYIPSPVGNIPVNQTSKDVLDAHMIDEEEKWNNCLKNYLNICSKPNVKTEILVVEKAEVSKGIVEMISELGIQQLIMGTTSISCRALCKKMNMQGHGKADYVQRHAIESCEVRIICKGKLVLDREGSPVDDVAARKQRRTEHPLFHLPSIKLRRTSIVNPSPVQEENHRISQESLVEDESHLLLQEKEAASPVEEENHCIFQEKDAAIQQIHDKPGVEPATSSCNNLVYKEYTLAEIKAFTCDFSDNCKLGEGGYGTVYKGEINGTTVAVKVLSESSLQGSREFQHEVDLLRNIHHPHLVRVVGSCSERGCILYEYMSNGSLADRLDCENATPPLPWHARIRIAVEVCCALRFLHCRKPHPIVHRDLKPENILLDKNLETKISDFGLARFLPKNPNLHTQTLMKGTVSYMDPEYLRSGEFSTKSDIYSLGIVILQLLTGKPALGLVNEVKSAVADKNLKEILDPRAGKWSSAQAAKLAKFSIRCTEQDRKRRPSLSKPKTMKKLYKLRDFAVRASNPGGPRKKSVETAQKPHDSSFFLCPVFKDSPPLNFL